jgi:hypothetical protein
LIMISNFRSNSNPEGIDGHDFFVKKNSFELSIDELAYVHLDLVHGNVHLKNCILHSNIYDLLENLTASFNNFSTQQYTPLFISFSILDQIGAIYERKDKFVVYTNGIKKALSLFGPTDISVDDINLLVSLRNGLFHNGSLVNVSQNNQPIHSLFRMTQDGDELLTHSIKPWDGIFHDDLSLFLTRINLKIEAIAKV